MGGRHDEAFLDLDDIFRALDTVALDTIEDIELLEGPELFKYLKETFPDNIYREKPGYPIREFSIPPGKTRNGYNPFMMVWTVSRHRKKELNIIRLQDKREDKLDGYAKELFDACFRNW